MPGSNIPHARELLAQARACVAAAKSLMDEAFDEMNRRKPDFRAPRELPSLTPEQKAKARAMRRKGMSILTIAQKLKTNHGRVSEACSNVHHIRKPTQ